MEGIYDAKTAAEGVKTEETKNEEAKTFEGLKIGVAVCGSFCTFKKAFETTAKLRAMGAEIIPIMSFNAAAISSRFGKSEENLAIFEEIAGRKAILSIEEAEPIGPKKMTDIMLLPNCTGNTMAKLAMSITDTAVVHLRKQCPPRYQPLFRRSEGAIKSCLYSLMGRTILSFCP